MTTPESGGAAADAEPSPFESWHQRLVARARDRRFEVGIPVRDGIELAADVYLPRHTDEAAPAIVEITPYNKDDRALIVEDALRYQEHDYVFVAVDVRGRGKSEGEWTAFVKDQDDCHDVVEWVAAQRWCNGRVGMTGASYMGWTQWAAASRRPPHLTCMVSTSAAGRWQQEIPYTYGAFQLYFAWWTYATRRRIAESRSAAPVDWNELLATLPYRKIGEFVNGSGGNWDLVTKHDTLDDVWRSLRFDDEYGSINVPCLHVTGWYDIEDLLGAFHHYEHMVAASPAADSQYLLVGPWSHLASCYPTRRHGGVDFGPGAALDMAAEHLRWFDHWLKDSGPGLDGVPRVRVFEPGTNVWRAAAKWPLSDTVRSLYLGRGADGAGNLDGAPGPREAAHSYRYDPSDPALTGLDLTRYPLEGPPLNQDANEARPDVLTFTGQPLADPVTVSGWAGLDFYAASDCDDTEWHVKLTDVHPDGSSYRVTQGCLRAACRDSITDPAPLTPGEVTRFHVELWPTHHVFLPGHRIRVTITSSDYPWFARSLNQFGLVCEQDQVKTAVNTVHAGGRFPSRLQLPVESTPQGGAE